VIRFAAGVIVGSVATVVYSLYSFRKMTEDALAEVFEQHENMQRLLD